MRTLDNEHNSFCSRLRTFHSSDKWHSIIQNIRSLIDYDLMLSIIALSPIYSWLRALDICSECVTINFSYCSSQPYEYYSMRSRSLSFDICGAYWRPFYSSTVRPSEVSSFENQQIQSLNIERVWVQYNDLWLYMNTESIHVQATEEIRVKLLRSLDTILRNGGIVMEPIHHQALIHV